MPPVGGLVARTLAGLLSGACDVTFLAGATAPNEEPDHRLWIVTPGAPMSPSTAHPAPVVLLSPRADSTMLNGVQATILQLDYGDFGRTLAALGSILPLEACVITQEMAAQLLAQDAFERAICHPAEDVRGKIAGYSAALTFFPDYGEVLARRGGAFIALGELDAGIVDCDAAIARAPDQAEAYYNRARAHSRREDYGAAMADYTSALERDPTLVWAYLNRGAARVHVRDYSGAIADYLQALALDPSLSEAHFNLSLAHAEVGDFERAMTEHGKTLRLSLDSATLASPAAGDPDQTLAYLARLLRRFPDHPAAGALQSEIERLALDKRQAT
jgi:tetratricopeptide (TPR) repeat protein